MRGITKLFRKKYNTLKKVYLYCKWNWVARRQNAEAKI